MERARSVAIHARVEICMRVQKRWKPVQLIPERTPADRMERGLIRVFKLKELDSFMTEVCCRTICCLERIIAHNREDGLSIYRVKQQLVPLHPGCFEAMSQQV